VAAVAAALVQWVVTQQTLRLPVNLEMEATEQLLLFLDHL
jgi:hypothetical protein